MARTNSIWLLVIYKDLDKKIYYKTLSCSTLKEIAYITNTNIYDVSNFYHQITKPKGIFNYLEIFKTS